MTSSCKKTLLSSHDHFKVEKCTCGSIHLHIGAMTLRIEPSALDLLAVTLNEAAQNNLKMDQQIEALGLRYRPKMTAFSEMKDLGLRLGLHPDSDDDFH